MRFPTPCMAALLLPATLFAQSGQDTGAQRPSAQAVQEQLTAELQKQSREFRLARQAVANTDAYKEASKARDREKMAELMADVKQPDAKALAAKAVAAAADYNGDDRLRLLGWAAIKGGDADIVKQVVAEATDQLGSPAIVELLENAMALSRGLGAEAAGEFLDKVIAESPNAQARAWAMYWQATMLTRGQDVSDENKQKAAAILADAEKLAEGTDLADRIRGPRFKEERLQIGMEAPDIVGEDVDGVPFKLSDYRGKVVVIDFWGFW